jgi:PleD family two-component response regulator
MTETRPKLLIVEDDLDTADMLNAYFHVQGYEVFSVNWGEDGVRSCQVSHPDLVILDISLPDMDGYEVAGRLRSDRRTADIPIIFLVEKRDRTDRITGLELGVDDYINKPLDVQELRLRVRNVLRRASQDALNNPITGLPDGTLVDEVLKECLQRQDWILLIISLTNLDPFRESYGFVASDDVMRAVTIMVKNALRESGSREDFFGHFGPAVFILRTGQERSAVLQEQISSRLSQSLAFFYPIKDREKSTTRGKRLSFKIDVLASTEGPFSSLESLKSSILSKKQ